MANQPASSRTRALLYAISWIVSLCLFLPPAAAQADGREQLLSAAGAWTDGVGTVLLTYETTSTDGRGAGRLTIGFDAATGAWFVADHMSGASGRTPSGADYQPARPAGGLELGGLNEGPVSSEVSGNSGPQHVSGGIDSFIPIALIVNMRETSVGLRAVERDADGNWVVSYDGPTADPDLKRVTRVTFDPEGTPLHYHADADPTTGRDEVDFDYEIEPQSPPGLAVVKQRQISPLVAPAKLVDVQSYPESRPELFTIEAAEALATDNRVRTQLRLAQAAAPDHGALGSSEPAPYVRTRLGGAGWPLIVTGVVVVVLGLIALWRTRAGK